MNSESLTRNYHGNSVPRTKSHSTKSLLINNYKEKEECNPQTKHKQMYKGNKSSSPKRLD